MSLFNTAYQNTIGIRAGTGLFEQLYTVNPSTGLMELVQPGSGGGGATLPAWVKPTSADFNDGVSNTLVAAGNVNVIDTSGPNSASLSSAGLALTGASGTRNIGWAEADSLSGLTTRESKPFPTTADGITLWDASAAKFKTVPWRNYLASSEIFMKSSAGFTALQAKRTQLLIGTCNSSGNGIDTTWPYSSLGSDGLALKSTYASAVLTASNMSPILRLNDKTAKSVPGATDQMLLWDTAAETYSYAPVPAGGGSAIPYYALPTKIALEDRSDPADTRGVYVEGNSLLVRPNIDLVSPSSGDFVKVENNRVTAGRYGTTTQLTALKRGGVEFRSGSTLERPDLTLGYDDALKVKGAPLKVDWKAPAYASWPATNYSSMSGMVITGYVGSIYQFPLDTIDSTLWIDLSLWAMPIASGEQKGILLRFGLDNPLLQLSYTTPSVGLNYYYVNVRKDAASPLVPAIFITFTNSSTINLTGYLKIKFIEGTTPHYPTVTAITPTSVPV